MTVIGSLVAGQVLTASELNAINAWTSFTPTWTGITAGTGASNTGQYSLNNKILHFRTRYVLGTSGSLSATPVLTVPASATLATSPTMAFIPTVTGVATNTGVANYSLASTQASTTTIGFLVQTASGTYLTNATPVNTTIPFTWAVGDVIEVAGWVQVA